MGIIRQFVGLSIPLKIVSAGLVSALAGSSVLYFLMEYQTYFYFISIKIRPPFEGTQYLSATVALFGLLLAICAAIVFLGVRWMLGQVSAVIVGTVTNIMSMLDVALDDYHRNGGKRLATFRFIDLVSAFQRLRFGTVFVLIGIFYIFVGKALGVSGLNPPKDAQAAQYILTFYFSVSLLSLWSKSFSWQSAIIVVFVFYISVILYFIDFEKYRSFLRIVGYGGGIPISVEMKDTKKHEEMLLAIRTPESLISEKDDQGEYVEIPFSNVSKITYRKNKE